MASSPSALKSHYLLLMSCLFISNCCFTTCLAAHRTIGFDLHHRFSDKVKGVLPIDGLPLKGSYDYYVAMAHRDRFLRGRHLASTADQSPLTFSTGNDTYLISSLGYLHYVNVEVGTPARSYLVALDTGSDLFWLPCECSQCVTQLNFTGGPIKLNIYNTNLSSTSQDVPCSSPLCEFGNQCASTTDTCPYQIGYVSANTSSTGFLVQDVLHLITDDDVQKAVNATITLGCGKVQTGVFLEGGAPNGLFGLGIEDIAVPTILAKQGLTSNSFSMCFGNDGVGRIEFGDNGTSTQKETPIDASGRQKKKNILYLIDLSSFTDTRWGVHEASPSYSIGLTQIIVGKTVSNISFSAIFDSGTSFTYINNPAYSVLTKNFNTLIREKQYPTDSNFPFEFCYEYNESSPFFYPGVNLTLQGGENFQVKNDLLFPVALSDKTGKVVQYLLCLGVIKSPDINLIGQNFMTGYRIVFDRERMILGWRDANCYSSFNQDSQRNTTPATPSTPPPAVGTPSTEPTPSPPAGLNPKNTSSSGNNTATPPPPNYATQSKPVNYALLILLFLVLTLV